MKKITSLSLLFLFVVLRTWVDVAAFEVSDTVLYLLEIFYIGLVYFLYRRDIQIWSAFRKKDFLFSGLFFIGGLLIFKMSSPFGILIPLDLKSTETIFLLLIVAPLLEEGIYRLAIWKSLEEISKNKIFLVTVTAILFSLGHFTPYFYVPPEFKSFIIYQTLYVLVLAIFLGVFRFSTKALSLPVLLHFFFNLGFLTGHWILL